MPSHINDTTLFSVLIANYNNGRYLADAINSVINQTYSNWEIVIIDDASTDNSEQVLTAYKNESRIRIYYNEKNQGCGYTKRECVEKANGSICGFLDSDDVLVSTALEVMVNAHLRNTEHSLIYSQFYFADESLEETNINQRQCQIPEGLSYLTSNLLGSVSHFATFKKQSYDMTGGIDSDFMAAIDVDLYLKLEEVGPIMFIPIPLYYYRINTGNNISLGAGNKAKSLGYEIIARANACKRRGLPFDKYVFCNLENSLTGIAESSYEHGKSSVINTKSYKIGKSLLRPLVVIKSFWKKRNEEY